MHSSNDIDMAGQGRNFFTDKANCWEIRNCGKQPGGRNVDHAGICPAANKIYATGVNGGFHAGRACWAIEKTFCGAGKHATPAEKQQTCGECIVYKQVKKEEGDHFIDIDTIRAELDGYIQY